MTGSPDSRVLVYVHTDIPPGMTIGEWRARCAANRPTRRRASLRVCGGRATEAVFGVWRAVARALARPRMARVRARGSRGRAPRPAAPPSQGDASVSVGSVYLLHFDPGLPVTGNRVARHYLGFAERDVQARVARHLRRQGSPLVAAVLAAGGRVTLERVWTGVDRRFERRLKRRHETPRLCPRCTREGVTGGRGPLSPVVERCAG